MTTVWEDDYYTQADKTKLLVALALADCADDDGYCFPSIDYLARKARTSTRGVQEACRELQLDGRLGIEIGAGRNGTNLYRVIQPEEGVQPLHPATVAPCNEAADEAALRCTQIIRNRQEPSEKKSMKARGTAEEIKAFCIEVGATPSDAEYFFNKWESNGWTNGGKKIKCWKSVIRSWKAAAYLPSQKPQRPNGYTKPPQRTEADRDYDRTGIRSTAGDALKLL